MQKQLQRTQYQNYSGSVNNKYYSFWVTIYYLDPLATSFLIQNGWSLVSEKSPGVKGIRTGNQSTIANISIVSWEDML